MEIYSTEEQQVEAIKSFWNKYGKQIIGGVAAGLALVYGYKYYQGQIVVKQEEAVQAFTAAAGDNDKLKAFAAQYSDSGLADLAELQLAKALVDAGDFAGAEAALQQLVDADASMAELNAVARIRLARVQAEQTKFDAALDTLDVEFTAGFAAQVAEVKGDILFTSGDKDGARAAYQEALLASDASNPQLQMKLDNLAVAAE